MTLARLAASESLAAGQLCSCCGAKLTAAPVHTHTQQLISENFLTVKGAAVFLPRGNGSSPSSVPRVTQRRNKHTGDLQQHLQTMFSLLRPEDTIRLAVRLESAYPQCTRYMVVVSTNGRQDTEESVVLGMDFSSSDCLCTVGLVLPLWSDTLIHLDGDGGFSVSTVNRVHVFKPVSVQAMWSALQSLHKACEVARCHNYYPGSLFLTWVSYYQSRICSEQHCVNEWNAMQDVQSYRADSPVLFTDVPTERERTERLIKTRLREIMMQKDLENVTSKEIRTELEMQMVCNLREFKEFIDNEMIVILGQMDSPTEIFDHVYLGSEWNASNLEELQSSGVRYILNVTREIDNFFPGLFEYHNIRVYDEEATNLLEYWNDTWKFISKAKKVGAKCLVHCKMGVSRSASTVIAYAMKEYGWDLDRAFEHVKERRSVTKPNPSFMKQLEEYQGILLASKQRHNKLWRSHSDGDLSEQQEPLRKSPRTQGCSDPHNNHFFHHLKSSSPPSIQNMLGMAVLQTLTSPPATADNTCSNSSTVSNSPLCEPTQNLKPEQGSEDPLLPPLPRPRAATVVPEQNLVERCGLKVAVTVPISCPHPPPSSLHALSPSVSLSLHALEPSHPVPEPKTDSVKPDLDGPDQKDSCQTSSGTVNVALYLDTVSTVSDSEGKLPSPGTPMAISPSGAPLALGLPLPNSDSESSINGAELVQRTAGSVNPVSSSLSTDSIDFFSAREKFLGLSQEGHTRQFPEANATQRCVRSRCSSLCLDEASTAAVEECSSHPESSCASEPLPTASSHHQDNGVSVRHMVTSLESISHARSPQHRPSLQEQGEVQKEERLSLPPSPSTPPCERPTGSVRRATEQLELRLRQEQESIPSRSPLHSPCSNSPDLLRPSVDSTCTDSVQTTSQGQREDLRPLDDEDSGIIPDPSSSMSTFHEVSASPVTVNPSLEPSSASSSLLWLEGVTELESDVDDLLRPSGRLARSSQDLQKIQETLRELQAFLYEAGGLTSQADTKEQFQSGQSKTDVEHRAEPKAPAMWQRAMEIEARLRQAGLTPPSLMKRSASLAKLDQLELSMHDLNDWDFHSAAPVSEPPSSSSLSHSHSHSLAHCPDDAHKKQRVLPQSPSSPLPAAHLLEAKRTEASTSSSFSCLQPTQEGEAEHTSVPHTVSVCTRQQQQQYTKPHPSRRLRKAADKKKTVTVLYNTM
ncbi:protein phosphatase Slingshot homolog 2 isoform X1 [Astyanax mexicanus]|uniref:protein phosphatase Slingshot homolog 2 isoform X1 n=1 Tax=Astyanax mexicanus TaxID=7994 RepID=UPI0020CB289E|nr:protein phosphatase Slingshot homolog 2 isoform X1 [Astyanax mexicanus]